MHQILFRVAMKKHRHIKYKSNESKLPSQALCSTYFLTVLSKFTANTAKSYSTPTVHLPSSVNFIDRILQTPPELFVHN